MSHPHKVIWSDEALIKVANVIDYLSDKWGYTAAGNFLKKLRQREILLSLQPEAFPKSQKAEGYRRSVLTAQITIYYKFENNIVEIRSVFDNRQNPNNLDLTEEETIKYVAG